MGEWSLNNAKNLSRLFNYFYLASGLKVNFTNSKLFGIGVTTSEVQFLASMMNCQSSQLPCLYLGLPIGCNMSNCSYWNPIIEKFQKRLST